MKQTKLLYLQDSYLKQATAKVAAVDTKDNQTGLILDQTIFYPQGGGQPADHGTITGPNGQLQVSHTSYNNGSVLHLGTLTGNLKKGDPVDLELDWDRRYYHIQHHTAGHILDEAAKVVAPEFMGVEGVHGIGKKNYIKFSGIIDASLKSKVQAQINQIIINNEPITTRMVTKAQIETENIFIPFKLPENKPLRLLQIGSRYPMPDGGTQLKSTGESWPIKITDFEYQDNHTLIHYQVNPQTKTKITKPSSTPTLALTEFESQLKTLLAKFDPNQTNPQIRTELLGKKGRVNQLTSLIPNLSKADRIKAGQLVNQAKHKIEKAFNKTSSAFISKGWLDVTQPGTLPPQGHLHPITQAIEEITRIFEHIGFTRVRYPEVDWDWYVFESLNMPPNHPARDEWETFFVDAPPHKTRGDMVLTTHTSNGQVREMERVKTPPIRMLNIAKCYRRQQDVTHTAMFHQFEGLVIDQGINIQHLKGTLDYFAKKFYGPKAHSRIRPFMFRFTEPSFEVDFSCTHCQGKGCRFCKSGWHEVGGAGMVHPQVLTNGGFNPDKYTGFAFGWGVERVYTLKPGLKLDDIRPLYSNNLDFLEQF